MFEFLFCPILALFKSLKEISSKYSQLLFVLFSFYFGLTLYVPAQKGLEQISVDSTYHRQFFEKFSVNETFGQWLERLHRYIIFDVDYVSGDMIKDFYFETLAYVTSFFSDSYHVLYGFAGLVFGFFMLKSLQILLDNKMINWDYLLLCVLLLFTYNQFIKIHSLRFPTAAWFSVWCILEAFYKGNKKYLFLLPLAIIIHGSYSILIGIVALSFLTRKNEKLWSFLFLVSLFVSSMPTEVLDSISSYLPSRFQIYFEYSTAETMAERAELVSERRTGMLINLFGLVQNVYINVLLLYLMRFYKTLAISDAKNAYYILYTYALPLFTVINMFAFIHEFSERYRMISYPLIAMLALYAVSKDAKIKKILRLVPFVLIYQMALYGYLYYMTSGHSLLVPPLIQIPYFLFTSEIL